MAITRTFPVENRSFTVTGLNETDPYLNSIQGRFEGKFQDFCRVFLEKDYVALDIGANIGAVSLILSHYLSEGKVFAIEPGRKIFETLQKNINDNHASNVMCCNYAISDKAQRVSFLENSAYGHIDASKLERQDEIAESDSIEALSLDELVEKLNLKRLDFIKVDIEGFEPQFFAGAKKSIARFNPVIYFELNTWCLIDHGRNNPIDFMHMITDSFRYIYRVNKNDNNATILERIDAKDSYRMLIHDNIVHHGSVNDVVVSNNPEKMKLGIVELASQVDFIHQELNRVTCERDALLKELSIIKSSRSYRYTSILRSIRSKF